MPKTVAKPIVEFKAWPGSRRGLAVAVKVYEKRSDMDAGVCYAVFLEDSGSKKTLGEIRFVRKWLSPGLIAHEATHAVICWARRTGLDIALVSAGEEIKTARGVLVPSTSVEEKICDAVGRMTEQVWLRAKSEFPELSED